MTDEDTPPTNWHGMARALMASIFESDLSVDQKQALFDGALRRSPKYAQTGDTMFESMLVNYALVQYTAEREEKGDCQC